MSSAGKPKLLNPEQAARLDRLLRLWVEQKGYCYPDRTLDAVAARMGAEGYALSLYLREHLGEDFRTWRNGLRVEEACRRLLEEPDVPASSIGRSCGFSDRSNFLHAFLAQKGMTPAQWRASQRAAEDQTTA